MRLKNKILITNVKSYCYKFESEFCILIFWAFYKLFVFIISLSL